MLKTKKRTPNLFVYLPTRLVLLLAVLFSVVASTMMPAGQATAAGNTYLNFQARLLTAAGSVVPDGDYNVEFKLYDVASGGGTSQGVCSGNCKWVETRTGSDKVRVVNGYLTVSLGSVNAFPSTINWEQQLWLTMNIGGTGSPSYDGEMSPRLILTAVPYAFKANKLASVAGSFAGTLQFASSFGQDSVITLPDPGSSTATVCYQNSASCGFLTGSAASYIQNTTSQQASSNFYISGDGKATNSLQTALVDSISGALAIGTTNATAINLNQNTNILGGKNLSLLSGTGTFSQVYTGSTTDATTITANSLSTGSALKVTSSNNSGANNAWSGTVISATNAQASVAVSTGVASGLTVALTQATSITGNNETVGNFVVARNDTSSSDNTVSSIVNLENDDTGTGNQISVTDALKINGTNVTNGINLAGTFGSNLITTTAGTSGFSVSSSGALTSVGVNANGGSIQGAGGLTISGAAVSLNANSNFNTSINTGTSTGTISLGGGASPFQLNSTALDVSTAGVISGATGITSSGTIVFSGLSDGVLYVSGGTGTLTTESNLSVSRGGTGLGSTTAYGLLAGGTTSTGAFQNVGTGTSGQVLQSNGPSALPTWVSTGSSLCADCIIQAPTTTAKNTIAPTTANVVALTVKGTTGTAANVLEIFDSTATPTRQAYFDSTGSLNVSKLIQPTANNTIDLGLTGTRFRSGYFGTSVSSPIYTSAAAVTLSSAAGNDITIDEAAAGTSSINIGTTNATSVGIGRSGQTTTVNGALTASQLLTASASAAITGTLTVTSSNTSGNSVSITNTALNTNNANLTNLTFANANTGATSTTISGLSITPTGSSNSNPSANKLNAINLPNVTTVTNNSFYAFNVGTGYDDILRYNGTPLISGTGLIQNAVFDPAITYSNIQKVGALSAGSIVSGFGTITTGNTITGTTLNGTTGINTGASAGTQRIDASGNLVNIGNITGLGAVVFSTPSGSSNTIAVQPGAGASLIGTVTKNAATGNEVAYDLSATINKSTSGNYTGIKLNVNESSAPGSGNLLLDLQVSNSSKFSVSNTGSVSAVGVNSGNGLIQGTGGLTVTGTTRLASLTTDGALYVNGGNGTVQSEANLSVVRGGTGLGSTTAYGLLAGGTTSTGAFQNVGTGTSGQILQSNGSSALPTWVNATSTVCSDCIIQNPTTTARNTIAPTTASVVALTVKGTTGTAANVLEVFDSSATPTRQAFFNSAGSLNISQVIQPTSNNAIDLGLSGTAFKTGYFATSLVSPSYTTNGAAPLSVDPGGGAAINIGTTNANSINLGNASSNISTAIRGTAVVRPSSGNDSSTAFQVQKADGSLAILNVDTSSNRVGINTSAPSADLSFGTGTDRVINVNQAASGNDGNKLTIQAGSGNGTNKNGGDVLIQGGNRTGSGNAGSVIIRPQADVANAFRVQNSASLDFIALDSASSILTLGNGTAGTSVAINCGTGACGFGNNGVAHITTLGSVTGSASTTVQAGTGGANVLSATSSSSNTGAVSIATGDETGSSLFSGAISIQTGNAAGGTNSSSGNISIDVGTKSGSGTTGTISIGTAQASALSLGRSGVTTINGGNFTVQGGGATLGSTTQQGSLVLHDGNGQTATISIGSALVANTALALPTALSTSDTFCFVTLNNCAGTAYTFNTAGDTGTSTVSSGQTVTVAGGNGLVSADNGSRTISLNVGAGTGITVDTANVNIDQAASLTWTGDETFTGSNTNNLKVNSAITSDVAQNAVGITLTDNASASTQNLYALAVTNADNSTNTGVPDAIGYFQNANAGETVPSGVLVEQTGSGGGTLTNGIEVKRTSGSIVNGLAFTGTMTNEIKLSQAETISNQGNGIIQLASDTGALTLSLNNNSSTATISNNTGNLIFDSASNTIALAASETTLQRVAAGTYTLDLQDASGATTFAVTNANGSQVANLTVEGSITAGAAGYFIAGNNINTGGTLNNVAYLNQTQSFTGANTFSRNGTGTGDSSLAITGTPINDATSSLIRIGNVISGGNAVTNGGTYLGINAPASGPGTAADFLNIQLNGANRLKLDNSGSLTVAGTYNTNTFTGSALTFGSASTSTIQSATSTTAGVAGYTLNVQGGNGASSTTGSAGGDVKVSGGTANGSGNNDGGDVYLYGGSKVNSGTNGDVILAHNGTNSVGNVGVGTAAPTRQLHVAVNTSSVNTLPLLVEQAGSGDTGLELKTSSRNYYLGVDNTDGLFKISSLTAANGTFTAGDTTIESSFDNNGNGTSSMLMTTGATGGVVSSISVNIKAIDASNKHIQLGIYSDAGGTPGTLLGSTAIQTLTTTGWNTYSLSGVTVAGSTNYWLAISQDGSGTTFAAFSAGGTSAYHLTSGYPLPSPFAANTGNLSYKISIYITYSPTALTDAFAGTPLFKMGDTGQTTFQNSSDSTSAFQIQSAAGNNLFAVDTVNTAINIGSVSAMTSASNVHIADTTSTTSAQTVTIGSAATNTGNLTLIQGGSSSTSGTEAIRIIPNASGSIAIGSTSGTGTITLGQSTTTNNINIGSANLTGAVTQTINIANGSQNTAASSVTVNILSNTSNNTTGTAILNLGGSDRVTGINIGNIAADAARTLNFGTGNNIVGIDTINIGTGNTTVAGGKTINIGTGTPSGSGTHLITIGNTVSNASTITLQGIVKLSTTPAAGASTAAAICRDTSSTNVTACDANNTTGRPFLQSGNGFGATASLGTTDAQNFQIITANSIRATFDQSNNLYLGNGVTNSTPPSFSLQGTGSSTAGTSGGSITVAGGAALATSTGSAGGNVTIQGANAGGSGNNNGGSVYMRLGAATGSGLQGDFEVQNSLGAALLTLDPSNTAASLNLVPNSGGETATGFTTTYPTAGFGTNVTVSQGTAASEIASGSGSIKAVITTTSANTGIRANLGAALAINSTYAISFSAKSTTAFTNDLDVRYNRTGTTSDGATATCSTSNSGASSFSATRNMSANIWYKITCFITTSGTVGDATANMVFYQITSANRTFYIDNLSVVLKTSTNNVQDTAVLKVGGSNGQGLTLFTLDSYATTPFTGANAALAGSMYYDTTSSKIQCYDGASWGACGAAPNNIITLSPEFVGAVLHSSGTSSIGTMTSDFCSSTTGININDGTSSQPSICGSNQTYNFYRWTSPQGTAQQYTIWVTYQLPSSFKNFVSGTTSLTAKTDSANATVNMTIFKNITGSALTTCSASQTISTGVQTNWQSPAPTTDPSTCSFAAGNSILFRIDVISSSDANAYVSNLNFAFSNQ